MAEKTRVGKFIVESLLAETDYSNVFLCRDPDLEIQVAVKVYDPSKKLDQDRVYGVDFWRDRFVREARALAMFDHPHIVPVRELRIPKGSEPFFVMPYLAANLIYEIGRDVMDPNAIKVLPENKRPRRLPVARATAILRQVLDALTEVHRRGMVHRDLKPGNILLTAKKNGTVKLCDFGMVKMPNSEHSKSGRWVGTLDYMSPEQRQSATDVDPRADIYAVGALAYRMLTGRLPLGAFRAPHEIVSEVPKALGDLVMRCLSPEREERPESAQAMLRRISRIVPEETALQAPVERVSAFIQLNRRKAG